MDKIMNFFGGFFSWLFKFLANFGVEVPGYIQDSFTTTAAPSEEATEA